MESHWILEDNISTLNFSKTIRKDVAEVKIVPLLLVLNGYVFSRNKFGKVLMSGPGIQPFEVGFGIYNMWFLQHWLEWSAGISSEATEVQVRLPSTNSWSGRYIRDPDLDVYPYRWPTMNAYRQVAKKGRWHSIEKASFWTYSSENVVKTSSPWTLRPVHRLAFTKRELRPSDLPSEAGYWKIPISLDLSDTVRCEWKRALDSKGFSYHFNPWKPELYFSNSQSSAEGLPPNAQLLGLPKLEIDLEADGSAFGVGELGSPFSSIKDRVEKRNSFF